MVTEGGWMMLKTLWVKSIEKRLLVMFIIFSVVLTVTVSAFRAWEVSSEFKRLELIQAEKYASILVGLLELELSYIDSFALDNAHWSETYNFVSDRNEEYQSTTLNAATLSHAELDGVLILDNSGENVLALSNLNLKQQKELWIKAEKVRGNSNNRASRGVMIIGDTPIFFAMQLITNGEDKSVSNGVYFTFLTLGPDVLSKVSAIIGVGVALKIDASNEDIFDSYAIDNKLHFALNSIGQTRELIKASFHLYSEKGRQIEVMMLVEFEQIQSRFDGPIFTLIPSLVLTTLVCIFLLMVIRYHIVKPILTISAHLHRLKDMEGKYVPMDVGWEDELGQLAENINKLFSRIYKKESFNKLLLSAIDNIVFVLDSQGKVTFATQSTLDWLKVELDEIVSFDLDFLLTNIDTASPSVAVWSHEILNKKQTIAYDCQLRTMTNHEQVTDAQVRGYPIESINAELNGAIVIIRFNEFEEYIDVLGDKTS